MTPSHTRSVSILREQPPPSGEQVERKRLEPPAYLLIESHPDGIFLYRFNRSGDCAGDTWHRSAAEARDQASHEYGDLVGPWVQVPQDIGDVHGYVLSAMDDTDIRMCVLDVICDDIENIDSILRMLNHPYKESWRHARGRPFDGVEVRAALEHLVGQDLVTPCIENPSTGALEPIPAEAVCGMDWDAAWFVIEPSGREAVERWWNDEGRHRWGADLGGSH